MSFLRSDRFASAPLKGLPQNVLKTNSQFTASRSSVRPSAPKREGGIKVTSSLHTTVNFNWQSCTVSASWWSADDIEKSSEICQRCQNWIKFVASDQSWLFNTFSAAELLAKEKEKKSAADVEICENSDRDELVDSIINDVVSVSTAVPVEGESASTATTVVAEKRRRSKTEAEPKAKRSRKVAVAESDEEEIVIPTANVVSSPVAQVSVFNRFLFKLVR